jgi:hypothetical protein
LLLLYLLLYVNVTDADLNHSTALGESRENFGGSSQTIYSLAGGVAHLAKSVRGIRMDG